MVRREFLLCLGLMPAVSARALSVEGPAEIVLRVEGMI